MGFGVLTRNRDSVYDVLRIIKVALLRMCAKGTEPSVSVANKTS
jgi:hypothetical protein